MKGNGNPFLNYDVTKLMADFDPTKMADQFMKLAGDYKVPTVDVAALVDMQRKNVEAITAANKVVVEGAQAVAKRQAELVQKAVDEARSAVEAVSKAKTPQDAAMQQVDAMKDAFEAAVANVKEMADMVAKSNEEAMSAINARISEGFEEIKAAATKAPAAKK